MASHYFIQTGVVGHPLIESIYGSLPLIFLKLREQNYFLFPNSNTLHNNFPLYFPITLKYYFFYSFKKKKKIYVHLFCIGV